MEFGPGTYALGFFAGTASILSPCVLPILPILIATALTRHRFGAAALALGLSLSFAAVGIFVATLGASIGLDPETLRRVAAALMVLFGLVMLIAPLQAVFARASSRFSNAGQSALGAVSGDGLAGQFLIGLLLGVVWSPCVGPTLGAATTLAAQGKDLGHIAALMVLFGLGAGLPLMILGALSRTSQGRLRSLATVGRATKLALGGLFVLLGVFILTGFDRTIETVVLSVSPEWLTALTTSL
jgi:cytochrome c-type biogenesis protein